MGLSEPRTLRRQNAKRVYDMIDIPVLALQRSTTRKTSAEHRGLADIFKLQKKPAYLALDIVCNWCRGSINFNHIGDWK